MAQPSRGLQALITLFAACAVLAGGAVALRLLGAARQGWAMGGHDVALLAIDGLLFVVNAVGWLAMRRAWAQRRG